MTAITLARFVAMLWVVVALLLSGCAGPKGNSAARGVSAQVRWRADSIAARMFVPKKQERQAETLSRQGLQFFQIGDSLLALLKKLIDPPWGSRYYRKTDERV